MSNITQPWHQVVHLRKELREGDLALQLFAADLWSAMINEGPAVYREPQPFFERTHATSNLLKLVEEVAHRLAGHSDKAFRKLALTYGGGKTHTLLTLYHLFTNQNLPDATVVKVFQAVMGKNVPQARAAAFPGDKVDAEKGLLTPAHDGSQKLLKYPWSIIAYQLAGDDGLRILHKDNLPEERETAPAEPLLMEVLDYPRKKDGLSTLVLMDEVLMFARRMAGHNLRWADELADFFQYFTQAAARTERCIVVVSLLANDPALRDELGLRIEQRLEAIISRQREEAIEPVEKRDVAEILRRQFFDPSSLGDKSKYHPNAIAAVRNIADLDSQTRERQATEVQRYMDSFPFHPELTEVLYGKWVQLPNFQLARGILRTFALALRDAVHWDKSLVVGPNVFLSPPGKEDISSALRELADIAAYESEDYPTGVRWPQILETEIEKARRVQQRLPGVTNREIEQAVIATFLHSQPPGRQPAQLNDLYVLTAHGSPLGGPMKIDLNKGLKEWSAVSWYLDDEVVGGSHDTDGVPQRWRMGARANLRQLCDFVRGNVADAQVEDEIKRLLNDRRMKGLVEGVKAAGAEPHVLPQGPYEVGDEHQPGQTPKLHYAILSTRAASEAGYPSLLVKRYLRDHTSEERPRVNKNATVYIVPSESGLNTVREALKTRLAWELVLGMPEAKATGRSGRVEEEISKISDGAFDALRQAYCLVATLSAADEPQVFKVTPSKEPLFETVKKDSRTRIIDTLNPEVLLPTGPYGLWKPDQTVRPARELVQAFFRNTKLPKVLRKEIVLDALRTGCEKGLFVLRVKMGAESSATYWRMSPSPAVLEDETLEVVLLDQAELMELSSALLEPERLPGLWNGTALMVSTLYSYFSGNNIVQETIDVEGYKVEQPVRIPRVAPKVIQNAVRDAVREGRIWLTGDRESLWDEDVPDGIVTDRSMLRPKPDAINPNAILPGTLTDAWKDGFTTARAIFDNLNAGSEIMLPWKQVEYAITAAVRTRLLEPAGPGLWPVEFAGANQAVLRLPNVQQKPVHETQVEPGGSVIRVAEAKLDMLQMLDLADVLGKLQEIVAGHDLQYTVRVELSISDGIPSDMLDSLNEVLQEVSPDLIMRKG